MNAMRLALPTYNPMRECQGDTLRDENKVAAYILSFQLVELFLKKFSGNWKLTKGELKLHLEGVAYPLCFDLNTGTLVYGTLRMSIVAHYSPERGLAQLMDEVSRELSLQAPGLQSISDPIFTLFTKLVEIFHARCGLNIVSVEKDHQVAGWKLYLSEEGPNGWISTDGIAENSLGERVDLKEWYTLRPEKMAAYVFGFNQFCGNYPSPFKTLKI